MRQRRARIACTLSRSAAQRTAASRKRTAASRERNAHAAALREHATKCDCVAPPALAYNAAAHPPLLVARPEGGARLGAERERAALVAVQQLQVLCAARVQRLLLRVCALLGRLPQRRVEGGRLLRRLTGSARRCRAEHACAKWAQVAHAQGNRAARQQRGASARETTEVEGTGWCATDLCCVCRSMLIRARSARNKRNVFWFALGGYWASVRACVRACLLEDVLLRARAASVAAFA